MERNGSGDEFPPDPFCSMEQSTARYDPHMPDLRGPSDAERPFDERAFGDRIASYDVEPVDTRPLGRWVLGTLATVTGFLAVIGWPIPVLPARYGNNHAWERNTELIGAWIAHDGWRTSGSSWFWGGVAIVATTWAISLGHRQQNRRQQNRRRQGPRQQDPRRQDPRRQGTRRWSIILLPGGVIAALGPLVQVLLGFPWSNYSPDEDHLWTLIVYAGGLAVAVGLPFLRPWVMRGRTEPQ
jgi:hypothetical protein